MTKNNTEIASLAMDLKRVALGFYSGSNKMARRFSQEALKRKSEISKQDLKPYLLKFLQKLPKILKQKEFNKLRPLGEPDFYVYKILQTIAEAKKEAWTPEILESFAKEEIETKVNESDITDQVVAEADLQIFEYSEAKVTESDKLFDRALSPTVKEAISREVGAHPIKMVERKKKQEEIKEIVGSEDNNQIVYDYSKTSQSAANKDKSEGFTADTIQNSSFQLTVYEIGTANGKEAQIKRFNFTPDYNKEERLDSAPNSGIAQMNWGLTEGVNTQTGVVEASGMVPTRVELNLSIHNNLSVPMISQEEAERLYPGMNLLLLALDSSVVETEIDKSYAEKIYYDVDFKKLDSANQARFVMYTGVRSGNLLLKYNINNRETAQKVIYIGDNEMYFEEADFTAGERDLYTFNTRNIMSAKSTELSVAPELINVFNSSITANKRTLNSYEIKMPTHVSGTRKYIEMKHLSDSIFIGTDLKQDVDVPSNEFIGKVLEMNQVNSLKDRCLVQINIEKSLGGITVNGKNQSGEMYTETSYLDAEGNFSKTDFDQAQKAFIVGDMEGIFNAKLEYSDGSTQFLKTYCSQGTYIVEQL